MWIEGKKSTTSLTHRTEKGDVITLQFNHNGRAECKKADGELMLAAHPALKEVKGPGPAPTEEAEAAPEEVNDDE